MALKFNSSVAGPPDGNVSDAVGEAENANVAATSPAAASTMTTAVVKQSLTKPEDISSPHELTAYVCRVLRPPISAVSISRDVIPPIFLSG
jgi:hypothetical protein